MAKVQNGKDILLKALNPEYGTRILQTTYRQRTDLLQERPERHVVTFW